jgi:DNA (cytosine-5)-methyltransferase 1
MTHKIFSFFSGAGFLDLGFEDENYKIVYVNENHAPFLESYKYSRKQLRIESPEYGYYADSITDFYKPEQNAHLQEIVEDSRRDGSLVGFIGGPPCPDFSIGGKNRGRHGDRGKLSQTYIDLICQQAPDFFLFENVKGLWKTKVHRHFYEELKALLWSAGYKTTERLTNSIEYGAPQDRERIILLGFRDTIFNKLHRSSLDNGSEFHSFPWLKFAAYPDMTAFDQKWPTTSPFVEESVIPCPIGLPKELTVQFWFQKNEVESHLNAEHCFTPKAGLARFQSVAEGDDSKKSFKRLHRWRYSPTAAYGNNEVHLHPYKPRRISVAEALAIQSLPRDFVLPPSMTLSNMFKTVGNGVPYLAARMIASSIKSFLEKPYAYTDSNRYCKSNSETTDDSRLQLHR